jgi:hypothetical protein
MRKSKHCALRKSTCLMLECLEDRRVPSAGWFTPVSLSSLISQSSTVQPQATFSSAKVSMPGLGNIVDLATNAGKVHHGKPDKQGDSDAPGGENQGGWSGPVLWIDVQAWGRLRELNMQQEKAALMDLGLNLNLVAGNLVSVGLDTQVTVGKGPQPDGGGSSGRQTTGNVLNVGIDLKLDIGGPALNNEPGSELGLSIQTQVTGGQTKATFDGSAGSAQVGSELPPNGNGISISLSLGGSNSSASNAVAPLQVFLAGSGTAAGAGIPTGLAAAVLNPAFRTGSGFDGADPAFLPQFWSGAGLDPVLPVLGRTLVPMDGGGFGDAWCSDLFAAFGDAPAGKPVVGEAISLDQGSASAIYFDHNPVTLTGAGLAEIAPFADDAMIQALRQFLDQLGDMPQLFHSWLSNAGPWSWTLMGLAVTTTAAELLRRRLEVARRLVPGGADCVEWNWQLALPGAEEEG